MSTTYARTLPRPVPGHRAPTYAELVAARSPLARATRVSDDMANRLVMLAYAPGYPENAWLANLYAAHEQLELTYTRELARSFLSTLFQKLVTSTQTTQQQSYLFTLDDMLEEL